MTQSMSSIDCEEGRERVKKNVGVGVCVCVRMTDGDWAWDRGDYEGQALENALRLPAHTSLGMRAQTITRRVLVLLGDF